jgi:hypothetical protein
MLDAERRFWRIIGYRDFGKVAVECDRAAPHHRNPRPRRPLRLRTPGPSYPDRRRSFTSDEWDVVELPLRPVEVCSDAIERKGDQSQH